MDQTLGFLDQLKEQHHEVASKTRQLHDKCERLVRTSMAPAPAVATRSVTPALSNACTACRTLRLSGDEAPIMLLARHISGLCKDLLPARGTLRLAVSHACSFVFLLCALALYACTLNAEFAAQNPQPLTPP